jgi:hypothetical protein
MWLVPSDLFAHGSCLNLLDSSKFNRGIEIDTAVDTVITGFVRCEYKAFIFCVIGVADGRQVNLQWITTRVKLN